MRYCILYMITAILILCNVGCSNRKKIGSILSDAENQMDKYPDSALVLLSNIDANKISTKKQKADYALLLSQAKDKCFIDETNDSLINIAVNYYRSKRSSDKRMKSYYYLGRIQHNAGLYPQANVSFTLAENDALKLSDYFYAGLIYRGIMNVYNASYNYKEEALYASKSYDNFVNAKAYSYAAYALYSLGISKFNQQRYTDALSDFIQVIKYAENYNDAYLEANARANISTIFLEQNNADKAREQLLYIKDSLNATLNSEWYTNYAWMCALENQLDSASYYMELGQNIADITPHDYQKIKFRSYIIDRKLGRYKSALHTYEDITALQDSIVRSVLEESVIAYQRDYFHEQNKFASFKLKSHIKLSAAIIVVLSLIIAVISRQKKLKGLEASKYMDKVCELEEHMIHSSVKMDEMSLLINKLFHDKFTLINQLSSKYYERKNTQSEQISIYEEVKKSIDRISTNKYTASELERIINECCDNIMFKMRTQLPHFREVDFQLISYIVSGFSYQAISIFMDTKIENLYKRMYRLKDRIATSDAPDKDFFIKEIA